MKQSTPRYPARRRGFTLVELVTAAALAGVLTMVVGVLLVSSHKHWQSLYGRVYREEAIHSFSAHRLFDAICRKSSYRKAVLGTNNESLELYYWDSGSTSATPDNYARFYLSGTDLVVEHGVLIAGTWTPDGSKPTSTVTAASNVSQVRFERQGASVQMILHYTDPRLAPSICSSVRQNF